MIWRTLVAVIIAISAAHPVGAQHVKSLCFRGRPVTHCRSFLLTEISTSSGWELGAMHNVGARSAVGGSLLMMQQEHTDSLSTETHYSTAFGAKARYRRWLNRTVAVDVSAGMIFSGPETAPGFASHAGIMIWDEVGLSIEANTVPSYWPEPRRLAWSASLRFGAHAGVVLGAIAAWLSYGCHGGPIGPCLD